MRLHQLLDHHGVARNPFAEEDAQTDAIFKDFCISSTYHPSWDKVYGTPGEPATSIVFGEKGSGKTAIRLQIARHLRKFNTEHPDQRVLVLHYDDFNPLLDRFRETVPRRRQRPDLVLKEWKLWDHMDAILSIAVTGAMDRVLEVRQPSQAVEADIATDRIDSLDRHQARDLLLLAACYDQSTNETFESRWERLRKRLKFSTWKVQRDFAAGIGVSLVVAALVITMIVRSGANWLPYWWIPVAGAAAGWFPWLWRAFRVWRMTGKILRRVRIGGRDSSDLRRALMHFEPSELASQPLPTTDSTDARYELLLKLQGIFQSFGYPATLVIVDRVDEPHLINGSAELMKALIWPMLDNKFLKQPGFGVKMMLPIELSRFLEREDRDFFQRARLDKQNMVSSFEWSGEALYDVANARLRACAQEGQEPKLRAFIDDAMSERTLIDSLRSLRTPRHLFKFLYRLLVNHCNAHTDDSPVFKVPVPIFESTLALYLKEQDAFDRGVGPG